MYDIEFAQLGSLSVFGWGWGGCWVFSSFLLFFDCRNLLSVKVWQCVVVFCEEGREGS